MDKKISSLRYEPPVVDLTNKNNSHTLIVDLAGTNKRILELGTSTGYISKIFKERGNRVTGVEIDAEAAERAQQFCDRMIIGDVETLTLDTLLEPASFDVIVCGDILEHLKRPADTVQRLRPLLAPGGYLVVSIPNFCHGDVILNLLNGDFHYRTVGLLDETHIHFFGLKNIFMLFSDCGFQVTDLHTTKIAIGNTELRMDNRRLPADLLKFLRLLPDSGVYQYVFIARPSEKIELPPLEDTDLKTLFLDSLKETIQEIRSPYLQEIAAQDQELCEQSTEIQALDRKLAEKIAQLTTARGEIRTAEGTILSLKKEAAARVLQLKSNAGEIQSLKKEAATRVLQLKSNAGEIQSLKKNLAIRENQGLVLRNKVAALEQKITAMEGSTIWQLTMKFHTRIIEPLFPPGSRRREMYDLGLKSGRILVSEGVGKLISEYKKRRAFLANPNPGATAPLPAAPAPRAPVKKPEETRESRKPRSLFDVFTAAGNQSPQYAPISPDPVAVIPGDIRYIAFYLPQFHPIPENDRWWGKGFTEWTNVTKAVPQYEGHYQPHLPGELGFYDLRLPEVQKRQVELARHYGLSGFCFYYYWFQGKRLLEMPLNQYLKNTELDLPFCICWANENWTRRWDGLENEILIAQEHTPESDIEFIRDVEHILRDPRYIRIRGKPVLIVYRTALLPEPVETVRRWREHCRSSGIGEIYLVAALTSGAGNPTQYGFDAALEFPPHSMHGTPVITRALQILNPKFTGAVYDYKKFVQANGYLYNPPFRVFKTVAPGWDNTARRANNASIFEGADPKVYKQWLLNVSRLTRQTLPPEEQFVFINAWNEWAEGTHLEPDQKFGYGYLQATAEVLSESRICVDLQKPAVCVNPEMPGIAPRIAVVVHIFYPDLLGEITEYLRKIPIPFDLYVSCRQGSGQEVRKILEGAFPQKKIMIREVGNQGFDIAPFLLEFRDQIFSYDYVCKLHGKKSSHWKDPHSWRRFLFNNLVGDPARILEIISEFDKDPGLGLVFPENFPGLEEWLGWGSNYTIACQLLEKYGIRLPEDSAFDFPAGSMYWFRPQALKPLFDSGFTYESFGTLQQTDGTLAHAIERIPLFIVNREGFTWKKVLFFPAGGNTGISPVTTGNPLREGAGIAVVLHLFYTELLDEFVFFLKNIPGRFDIFISVPPGHRGMTEAAIRKHFPHSACEVTEVENNGYDIYPFICLYGPKLKKYSVVLKIHGKKSTYNPSLSGWRHYLLGKLLGSQPGVEKILKEFADDPRLGLLFPDYYAPIRESIEWGSNFTIAQKMVQDQNIILDRKKVPEFPAGSMFWFRPEALSLLFSMPLKKEDFVAQGKQAVDGTPAHAIERLIALLVERNMYTWKKIK